nr:MAG TPA: hypothetical protein [Caudoviricetes sp.]
MHLARNAAVLSNVTLCTPSVQVYFRTKLENTSLSTQCNH